MEIVFERINGDFELEASDVIIVNVKEVKNGNEDRMYRLTTYRDAITGTNFYSFGVYTPDNKPGHGGEWSSNAKHINTIFNTDITECTVQNRGETIRYAMACEADFVRQHIPDCLEELDDDISVCCLKTTNEGKYGNWGYCRIDQKGNILKRI